MFRTQIIMDALKDALMELEEIEAQYDEYSAGAVAKRLERAIEVLNEDIRRNDAVRGDRI